LNEGYRTAGIPLLTETVTLPQAKEGNGGASGKVEEIKEEREKEQKRNKILVI